MCSASLQEFSAGSSINKHAGPPDSTMSDAAMLELICCCHKHWLAVHVDCCNHMTSFWKRDKQPAAVGCLKGHEPAQLMRTRVRQILMIAMQPASQIPIDSAVLARLAFAPILDW